MECTPSTDGVKKFWISSAFLKCLSRGKIFSLIKKTPLGSTAIQSELLELLENDIFEQNKNMNNNKIWVLNILMFFLTILAIFFELFFSRFLGQCQQPFSCLLLVKPFPLMNLQISHNCLNFLYQKLFWNLLNSQICLNFQNCF